jgi:sterol desaturase/sphingolipid hydroxylase (fatty acid hydroxylase superfamily)
VFEVAVLAKEQGFGLLNALPLSGWVAVLITILIMDFAIYTQHIVFHKIPLLWRFHRVHHLDKDLDVTSGNRFHPVEMILSLLIKASLVYLLGLSPSGVIIFAILLNGSSLFNHANIYIPEWMDRLLCFFIVTPDMHRTHHSTVLTETDSNFGFFFSFWDRVFNTYTFKEFNQQKYIEIGLSDFPPEKSIHIKDLLLNPFKDKS